MNTRRTKIVCTLGPASNDRAMIQRLFEAGMNVARINMSHGTREEHAKTISRVREVASSLGLHVPILLDLTGPKMRVAEFAAGSAVLQSGDSFVLTTRDVPGDHSIVSINYPPLIEDVKLGDRLLLGDGGIELRVAAKSKTDLRCDVVIGGDLTSNQGINAPGVKLRQEVPTAKDISDADFGMEHDIDWFAFSFVRYAHEVERLREYVAGQGADIPIVVKIEKTEALENLDEIIAAADGVMIARGDLGLEIPLAEVPLVQKDVIHLAIDAGKPVITATQMLESMIKNPRPTRAEAADVANAVFDGTDAVMLSGETAVGRYPNEAVKTMAQVAEASEARIDYGIRLEGDSLQEHGSIAEAVSHAACNTAIEIGASAIICCTRSGQTARLVSRSRPPMLIAAVSPNASTLRRVGLYWNTVPVATTLYENFDDMTGAAKQAVLSSGIAERGDRVVIVAGVPIAEPGSTNLIKGDVL